MILKSGLSFIYTIELLYESVPWPWSTYVVCDDFDDRNVLFSKFCFPLDDISLY